MERHLRGEPNRRVGCVRNYLLEAVGRHVRYGEVAGRRLERALASLEVVEERVFVVVFHTYYKGGSSWRCQP